MVIKGTHKCNILFISHDALMYGPGRCLLVLVDGLVKKGYYIHIVVPSEGPLTNELQKRKIPFTIIRFHWWISGKYEKKHFFSKDYLRRAYYRIVKPIYNLFIALPKFKQIVTQNTFDIVVNNSMVTPIGILVKHRYKIPTILYI